MYDHHVLWPGLGRHTGTALILEGCTLQCGLTLKPCLIWLSLRDDNLAEGFLCSVATELESPGALGHLVLGIAKAQCCTVKGWIQGGAF